MRSIDYFDRGHDRDPARLAIVDTASGLSLSFAEVKQLTEREGIAHTFTETAGGRPALKIRLLGHADGTFVTEPLAESAPIA